MMRERGSTFPELDTRLVSAYMAQLRAGCQRMLARVPDSLRPNGEVPLSPSVSARLYYALKDPQYNLSELTGVFSREKQRQQFNVGTDVFANASIEKFENQQRRYEGAMHLLAKAWPEFHDLIQTVNPWIAHPPTTESYESASDPKHFGLIYFNMKRSTEVDWARILVHEMAHHYLFVLTAEWATKGVTAPWSTMVFSHIRNTERPLIGVLHGGFAQAAMLELARRLMDLFESEPTSAENVAATQWIYDKYAVGFLADCETLDRFGLISFHPDLTKAFAHSRSEVARYLARKVNENVAS